MSDEPHGCTHKVDPGKECEICAAYADRTEYRRSLGLPKRMAEPSERVAQSAKELNFAMAMAEFAFRRCEMGWNWEKTLEAILANVTPVRATPPSLSGREK